MAVIPNSCRECNQHDCVNHQFEWFMKNNPNINNANSVSPACPLLKEVSQAPTTKNDLGVDCISREQALNEFCIYNSYDSIGVDKVRSYLRALPPVTPQEPRWIPVDDPYTELPKKDLWVTRCDNGNLCVDRIYYDMTEWNDYIGDVVAYMEYKEPIPYKEVIEE